MEPENKHEQHLADGSDDLLVAGVGWVLQKAVIGGAKLYSLHQKKKWEKVADGIKVGDTYTGALNEKAGLEVHALEGVRVGLVLEEESFEGQIDNPGFETLRECYGAEGRLSASVSIAMQEGLDFSSFSVESPSSASQAPSSKMIRVTNRKETLNSTLVDFAKAGENLELKVACLDSERLTVWFFCEKIEREFIKRVQSMREGVDAATKEHCAILAQKTISGKIVGSSGDSRDFEVSLSGVSLHDVRLKEPAWNAKQRYECLTTGYFKDYIRENWLGDHEFTCKCVGGEVFVNSLTIDRALGIEHKASDNDAVSSPFEGRLTRNAFIPKTRVGTGLLATGTGATTRIIVDASNVVRADEKISWRALRALIRAFERQGRDFVLMFDANIDHVLEESGEVAGVDYVEELKRKFPNQILIVPAGSQADDFILFEADKTGAHILSRDRYRDEKFRVRYEWLSDEGANSSRVHKFSILDSKVSVPDLDIREDIELN